MRRGSDSLYPHQVHSKPSSLVFLPRLVFSPSKARFMIERARKNAKIGKNNAKDADVAQLVEQLIRNEQVTGSIPAIGSIFIALILVD